MPGELPNMKRPTYTISARVIDVETGEVIRTPGRRYQGSIDELFDEMAPIASEIIGKRTPPVRRQTAPANTPHAIKRTQQETIKTPQEPVESIDLFKGYLVMVGMGMFVTGLVTGNGMIAIVGVGLIVIGKP